MSYLPSNHTLKRTDKVVPLNTSPGNAKKHIVGGVTAFLGVLLCCFFALQYQQAIKLANASKEIPCKIRRENLLSASPARVIASLDRDKIDHSNYVKQDKTVVANFYGAASIFTLQGGPRTWDVEVVLHFDGGERLVSYSVSQESHGF